MEVRYVGWSINPARRLRSHTSKSTLSKEKNHRAKWVASVLRTGSKPVMEVIESGVADFAERERFWISHFRDLGCRLTNGTDGGEGMEELLFPDARAERDYRKKKPGTGCITRNQREAIKSS